MYRSQTMKCYSLAISDQASWETINTIGSLGAIHFNDENKETPFISREFYNYIKRCDEVENKLNYFRQEAAKLKMKITKCEHPQAYLSRLADQLASRGKPQHTYFDEVEQMIDERHKSLTEQVTYYQQVTENLNKLNESIYALKMAKTLLPDVHKGAVSEVFSRPEEAGTLGGPGMTSGPEAGYAALSPGIRFTYIAGVINSSDVERLKKITFRVTRGNAFTITTDIQYSLDARGQPINPIKDPQTGEVLQKSVYLIIYSRTIGSNDLIRHKIYRIIDSLEASRIQIPDDPQQFSRRIVETETEISQTTEVVSKTRHEIYNLLKGFIHPKSDSPYSPIEEYKMYIVKEKTIYSHLNMMKRKDRTYYGRIWVPEKFETALFGLIDQLTTIAKPELKQIMNFLSMGLKPPTYFQTNDFTMPFQEIVNTYGVPRYKEVNPGIFACATFPLLFGIMFGDMLHGSILSIIFGYTVLFKDSIEQNNGLFKAVLPFRYLLFLMGCCAFYFGTLYNDAAGFATDIFGSCYDEGKQKDNCIYPWGIDPAWSESDQSITFLNSLKMKMAVIYGIIHMIFGILQKGSNAIYFRSPLDFLFEFIPQVVFFLNLFGYMVALIFIKWAKFWDDGRYAPSIITLFINLTADFSSDEGKDGGKWAPLYDMAHDGALEHKVEIILLVVALVMVPLMLIVKPVWLVFVSGGHHHAHHHEPLHNDESGEHHGRKLLDDYDDIFDSKGGHEEESSTEIFIHQMIETIEFVLGSISNTASYLRLWALSLAHSQLAEVFFGQTVGTTNTASPALGIPMTIIAYLVWMGATIGVLLLMDVMECFLHALRLHWVEFQNKFFKADGYLFTPLSFNDAIKEANAKEES